MRARETHEGCLLLARPFFLLPTTSKRLLRRLAGDGRKFFVPLASRGSRASGRLVLAFARLDNTAKYLRAERRKKRP